jgi:hypothetical protein
LRKPFTAISTDKEGVSSEEGFPNLVGGGLLKRFVVTFHYHSGRIYLNGIYREIADLATFSRAGMWISKLPAGFTVMDVTPGGPADRGRDSCGRCDSSHRRQGGCCSWLT